MRVAVASASGARPRVTGAFIKVPLVRFGPGLVQFNVRAFHVVQSADALATEQAQAERDVFLQRLTGVNPADVAVVLLGDDISGDGHTVLSVLKKLVRIGLENDRATGGDPASIFDAFPA